MRYARKAKRRRNDKQKGPVLPCGPLMQILGMFSRKTNQDQYTKIMRDRIRVSSTDGKVQYQVLRYKGGVYTIVAQFNTRTEAKRFIDSKTAR